MKIFNFVLIVATLFISPSVSTAHRLNSIHSATQSIDHFIRNLHTTYQDTDSKISVVNVIHDVIVALSSSSFPTAVSGNVSDQCRQDSLDYVHHLYRANGSWARQMQESSGKLPVGLLGAGNFHADGLFDECLAVQTPSQLAFRGQYCTVFFKPAVIPDDQPIIEIVDSDAQRFYSRSTNLIDIFHLIGILSNNGMRVDPPRLETADVITYVYPSVSLCLPSSCTSQDLGLSVAELIGGYVIADNYSIATVADEGFCFSQNDKTPELDGPDIAVIVVLSVIGLLVVMGTISEAFQLFPNGKSNEAVRSFSILANVRQVLFVKSKKMSSNQELSCVNGIRVLSAMWVVIGHTWIIGAASNAVNRNMVRQDAMKWWFQGIGNATLSVDSFLFVGGLLVSYITLNQLDKKKGRVNPAWIYLHRYLRLTPVYAVVLGFMATLAVDVAIGPNWYNVQSSAYGCRINWWRHFLYINNLFPTDINIQCMEQSWYLALDMQLFLLAIPCIYLLWHKKNAGLSVLTFFLIGTLAANFAVFAVFDLMPTTMPTRTMDTVRMGLDADYYYTKPWTRAPPYIIGVWLGWFLHGTKNSQKRTSKIILIAGWTLSLTIMASVVYGLTPYLDEDQVPSINQNVKLFYGSLHRAAWAVSLAWIVFACQRGYGGYVNRFLSWKAFGPLSRLSYGVFLIHYDYLNMYYAANRKLIYYTFYSHLNTYYGILATAFALALVLSVTVEISLANLEKKFIVSMVNVEAKPEVTVTRPNPTSSSDRRPTSWKTKSFDKF